MKSEETEQRPQGQKRPDPDENGQNLESYFSPGFKSVAAMAGWDEESILVASLIVEDTPERGFKHRRRSFSNFKTPPFSASSRKRGSQTKSPIPVPLRVLNLDEEELAKQESEKKKQEVQVIVNEDNKAQGDENDLAEDPGVVCTKPDIPCMDKLKEELSCAICLEICFEPSTTSCGHSFCKKCLRSAADKCGKRCPKCRQLISNGRTCKVNTVLWNTIQLLFPQEIEARKAAGALNEKEAEHQSPQGRSSSDIRRRSVRRRESLSHDEDSTLARRLQRDDLSLLISRNSSGRRRREIPIQDEEDSPPAQRLKREELSRIIRRDASGRRRRGIPSQDEDAALALRLQREEFMEAFKETNEHSRSSLSLARANLRAMASRAINIRTRGQPI